MRSFWVALVFGVLVCSVGYAQDKTDKSCCSSEDSETSLSKMCDGSDEISLTSNKKDNQIASIQGDDQNKKVEKKVDKEMKKDKAKSKSTEDGCCSPDTKKTEKIKKSN